MQFTMEVPRGEVIAYFMHQYSAVFNCIREQYNLIPDNFKNDLNLHDFNGNCIWSNINLMDVHEKLVSDN